MGEGTDFPRDFLTFPPWGSQKPCAQQQAQEPALSMHAICSSLGEKEAFMCL